MSRLSGPREGDQRYDYQGAVRVMAVVDGWLMVRRPVGHPFVVDAAEWLRRFEETQPTPPYGFPQSPESFP